MAVLKFIPCLAALTLVLQGAWCSTIISAEACLTKYGSTSVKSLGTTTYSITLRQTESCIATVTPTTTIQPAPKTVTASSVVFTTKTSTFPNTQISTLTTTQTVQSTTTVTNTITSMTGVTVDVSVTGTVSTVTVPTSAGFVPASQNGLNKQKRQESRARPNLLAGHRPNLEKRASSSIYPTTVSCGILVHIIATNSKTATASKTATVTGMPSTVTMTAYTTSTVVSSYLPAGASTTVSNLQDRCPRYLLFLHAHIRYLCAYTHESQKPRNILEPDHVLLPLVTLHTFRAYLSSETSSTLTFNS